MEVFHTRWPLLKDWLLQHFASELKIVSVFLTAVSPQDIRTKTAAVDESYIRSEVVRLLTLRGKDSPEEIQRRADTAVSEILEATRIPTLYDRVLISAPEGPDGKDDWTRERFPVGQAAATVDEFLAFVRQRCDTL